LSVCRRMLSTAGARKASPFQTGSSTDTRGEPKQVCSIREASCYDPRSLDRAAMTLFLQSVLLFAAGIGLFLLWRFAAPSERWLKLVVAAGFLARAVAGQLLFWISWARLPIARSLQMGDGFWIFAQDSTFYFPQAVAAVEQGWRAILFFDRGAAAPSYMQL